MNEKQLTKAALEAHGRGETFEQFWSTHAGDVRSCEPFDRQRFNSLANRLAHLVLTGDRSGQFAVGDDDRLAPWDEDDQAKPHDTITQAVCQLSLFHNVNAIV